MEHRGNRSVGFGRRQMAALSLAGVLGLAAFGGAMKSLHRFGGEEVAAGGLGAVQELAAAMDEAAAGTAWDLPNLDHPRVDHFVGVFTGRQRASFATYLSRMGRYQPMISAKLEERGMPQELIYLAMIESGFNPRAYSHAHASGIWQFIPGTGQGFGLAINRAVDERNDPEKATDAALTYLQSLYDTFGSWYLAAAAYNGGQGRLSRIMRQETGSVRGTDETFYRISHRLPRETRDYVPLIVAAARIAKDPAGFGFDHVRQEEALVYDTVTVGPATSLAAIARSAGTTVTEIRRLNPQLKMERTRNDASSPIRIPAGARVAFEASPPRAGEPVRVAQAQQARPRTPAARQYRVRRGDTLGAIAQRHGTTVRALRQANNLRGDRIRAGAVLRIPATG